MKKIGLLFVAFGLAVAANAQLRVDSLGRSEFGVIPRENFDKIADATVTVYGEDGKSTMNLYMPAVKKQALDFSSPYFIQCVSGTSNESGIGKQKYTRRFYVTGSGDVYAKGTVIQPAVDPSFSSGGSIGAGGVVSRSKAVDIQSPLSRLSNISGVSYAVEEQSSGDAAPMNALLETGQPSQRLGLIAEEVEAGVPEAVVTLDDGSKGISYSDLVVVLIDAVNELSTKVTMLEEQLAEARDVAPEMRAVAGDAATAEAKTYVEQNAPNPSDGETVIRFGLADDVSEACLCIYDLQGRQVERIDLAGRQGQVVVAASDLGAGMYIYSLIADGQEVASHRMILTD